MKNLDDLLDTLKRIQDAYPTNEAGDKTYALSLWPDWDGTSIENVNQLTKWYGQEVNGSILLGTDNSITPLTDKDGAYYKMLKFLYKANQMGLVDPDSATQDWNAACDKMRQGRVHLCRNCINAFRSDYFIYRIIKQTNLLIIFHEILIIWKILADICDQTYINTILHICIIQNNNITQITRCTSCLVKRCCITRYLRRNDV